MIQLNARQRGFVDSRSGEPFLPVGVNYSAGIAGGNHKGQHRRFASLFGVDPHTEADGLSEAKVYLPLLADLGMNVLRVWLEPHDMHPYANALDVRDLVKKEDLHTWA